jgi:hypothetical protein
MKTLVTSIAFLGLPILMQAQCNCQEEFSKIKNQLESNYPGFKDKVTTRNLQNYQGFTAQKEQVAAQAKNKSQCYFIINQWMSYFNDNHLYTGLNTDAIDKIQPQKKIGKSIFLCFSNGIFFILNFEKNEFQR